MVKAAIYLDFPAVRPVRPQTITALYSPSADFWSHSSVRGSTAFAD
jgi:hypothetical protein